MGNLNIIPNLSKIIYYLESNPNLLEGINRGIERESLRVNLNCEISQTSHPKVFGSPLTHKFITTDFSESLIEIITPVHNSIDYTFNFLKDIHKYIYKNLNGEFLWPMSMPCSIKNIDSIRVARYGKSNLGKMKTIYRIGLKNRYGSNMQIIAGIHYNFSLPKKFWKINSLFSNRNIKNVISEGYLNIIRNYYKFGWIIPYLFGASPGVCNSFIKNKKINLPLKKSSSGLMYLPYATSLRLSNDLGYNNNFIDQFKLTFNSLRDYLKCIKWALNTSVEKYEKIGILKKGKYLQLNSNILQIENELYSFIRPKRITKNNESLLNALFKDGIEYIEIRSLDINPFSPLGFNKDQVYFLDLFLIWCALINTIKLTTKELIFIRNNWRKIILEGRKPGLSMKINSNGKFYSISVIGKCLIQDLKRLAIILDKNSNSKNYQKTCDNFLLIFNCPEMTISSKILQKLLKDGVNVTGLNLANIHSKSLKSQSLSLIKEKQLTKERYYSLIKEKKLELDNSSFKEFLISKCFNKNF